MTRKKAKKQKLIKILISFFAAHLLSNCLVKYYFIPLLIANSLNLKGYIYKLNLKNVTKSKLGNISNSYKHWFNSPCSCFY